MLYIVTIHLGMKVLENSWLETRLVPVPVKVAVLLLLCVLVIVVVKYGDQ
jgi:hypothetical protein